LIYPYPVVGRSVALGSTSGADQSSTATSSALILLNGTQNVAEHMFFVNGQEKGKALVMFNETGDQAILTASGSGTTRFTLDRDGSITQTSADTSGIAYTLLADSVNTGTALDISIDAVTSGVGLNLTSTSTSTTAPTTARLAYLNWAPGSSTTIVGDLFRLNIGSNGNVTNLFNVTDNGSTLFRVAESQIESAVPHSFTAAGDVTMAFDILFTNQTASFIKTNAPFTLEVGESFESNNLTLRTYSAGDIILELGATGQAIVGPATASGVLRFNVFDQQDATAAALIYNTSPGTNADGLVIKLGALGTVSTNNEFISFLNSQGKTYGRIRGDGGTGVSYQTGTADFAEYFVKSLGDSFETGDVVSFNSETGYVSKSGREADPNLLGVISAHPGFVGGDEGPDKVLVGLVGQLIVTLASDAPAIKVGDFITSSAEPGRATKATKPGQMIGKAIRPWNPGDGSTILIYLSNIWADPNATLAFDTSGNLTLNGAIAGDFVLESGKSIKTELENLASRIESTPAAILALDALVAGQASGIESLETRITTLEGVGELSKERKDRADRSAGSLSMTIPGVIEDVATFIQGIVVRGTAIIEGTLDVIGQATFQNLATFLSDVLFQGSTRFTGPASLEGGLTQKGEATFSGLIRYEGSTEFSGDVSFGSDTAGIAVIPKWVTIVDVPFEREYLMAPIVTITLRIPTATDSAFLSEGVKAAVAETTTRGFSIVLDGPAPRDLEYNWVAIAVRDVRRTVGKSVFSDLLGEATGSAELSLEEATESGEIPTESGTP
jgi:hypothetical protein